MKIRRRPPNPAIDTSTVRYQVDLPDTEPRNILEKIVWHKEREIDRQRERLPFEELRKRVRDDAPPVRDFLAAIASSSTQPAAIAEVKKASPSKGVIREDFDPVAIATAYQSSGASCLSVLTDVEFFQGSFENLSRCRQATDLPVLCKDFILYPYQIYLARYWGADAILAIAAILEDRDLSYFLKIAKVLGMTVLVEVHTLDELDRVLALEGVTLVGINNRNLEDFSVDLETTCRLLSDRAEILSNRGIRVVSESGLQSASHIEQVRQAGADAVLIGESLLVCPDPAAALLSLFAKA